MHGYGLYLEGYSGISGDMTVGALLDLGADFAYVKEQMEKLPLTGYTMTCEEIVKKGIQARAFRVHLEEEPKPMWEAYEKEQSHHHAHSHRHYREIRKMITESSLDAGVKTRALRIFQVLAEAEGHVHGCAAEDVAFHEVGAVDSIVDIVGIAACLENLHVEKVFYSRLYEGQGQIHCQHGWIPVPVPAVLELVTTYKLPIQITENQGEMITPTGAAVAAALGEYIGDALDGWRMIRAGMGAGEREFPRANVLRAILLEAEQEPIEAAETVWVLESNVDDCSGERLGYAIQRLLDGGARDAACLPMLMKKGRPGYLLQVICDEEALEGLEDILFRETTSIGLRKYKEARTVLPRKTVEVLLKEGRVRLKVCQRKGEIYAYPEYEDVREIAEKTGESYQVIYERALQAAGGLLEEGHA